MVENLARASLVLALLLPACGSDDHAEGIATGAPVTPPATGCVDGQVRECRITLAVHEGYTDCVTGKQRCAVGGWSACVTDKVFSGLTDAAVDAESDVASPTDAGGD